MTYVSWYWAMCHIIAHISMTHMSYPWGHGAHISPLYYDTDVIEQGAHHSPSTGLGRMDDSHYLPRLDGARVGAQG